MNEEKTPRKKVIIVDHKEQFEDHQEYCKLKLEFENLTKAGQKKYSKKERMAELETKVKKFDGKLAATKKDQGIAKMSVKGSKLFISQDIPNPKLVTDRFSAAQVKQYFK